MHNKDLAFDYIKRATIRIKSVRLLFAEKSWADVVRESQECVELALKGFLRNYHIDPPRIHDVSEALEQYKDQFPKEFQKNMKKVCQISRSLRRDRELSFYGSEDLTPSDFYKEDDAAEALKSAEFAVKCVAEFIKEE